MQQKEITGSVKAISRDSRSMFLEKENKDSEDLLLLCLNAEIDPIKIKLTNTTIALLSWLIGRETKVTKPVKAKLSIYDKISFSRFEK
jgi:hypothetical protein